MSGLTKWKASRHNSGRNLDPVCNNIFKNAGRENYFEVEKVERKKSNLIHIDLTYRDSNQLLSNQVNSNHDGSNQVAAHQSDSNYFIFDTADSTNIKAYF